MQIIYTDEPNLRTTHYIPVHCEQHFQQFLMASAQIPTVLVTELDNDLQHEVPNFQSPCYKLHVRWVLSHNHINIHNATKPVLDYQNFTVSTIQVQNGQ